MSLNISRPFWFSLAVSFFHPMRVISKSQALGGMLMDPSPSHGVFLTGESTYIFLTPFSGAAKVFYAHLQLPKAEPWSRACLLTAELPRDGKHGLCNLQILHQPSVCRDGSQEPTQYQHRTKCPDVVLWHHVLLSTALPCPCPTSVVAA